MNPIGERLRSAFSLLWGLAFWLIERNDMSVQCKYCGAVAGRGYELGHRSDCPILDKKLGPLIMETKSDLKHHVDFLFKFFQLGYKFAIKTLEINQKVAVPHHIQSMREYFEDQAKKEGLL